MSTTTQNIVGYAQGADTAAVLTNRSKYITIISDKPYFSRHATHFPPVRHEKGSRPMHRTTLTFEVCPGDKPRYISCMKAVSERQVRVINGGKVRRWKFVCFSHVLSKQSCLGREVELNKEKSYRSFYLLIH